MRAKSKTLLAICALAVGTFCFQSNVNAQGFRIGNFIQAGGGQGFRMGGPRVGMHFGGGQGATFGAGRFGMRFGNGQGARIGGANYGMQFGGQQGTQIGRFATTPVVQPGTYYYNDVFGGGYAVPAYGVQQVTYVEPVPVASAVPMMGEVVANYPVGTPLQPYANAAIQPTEAVAIPGVIEPNLATPSDVVQPDPSGLSNNIRITHSATATEDMKFSLNGSDFTLAPGKSMNLEMGDTWNVAFSAGGEHGDRVADLSKAGSYVFMSSPSEGWVLMDELQMNSATGVSNELDATNEVVPANEVLPSDEVLPADDVAPLEGESVIEIDVPPMDTDDVAPQELDEPLTPEEILDGGDDG
jgi:hypothetical protein